MGCDICKHAAYFSYMIQKASCSRFLSQWYFCRCIKKILFNVSSFSDYDAFYMWRIFPSVSPSPSRPPPPSPLPLSSTRELTWSSLWATVCGQMTNPFYTFTGIWVIHHVRFAFLPLSQGKTVQIHLQFYVNRLGGDGLSALFETVIQGW